MSDRAMEARIDNAARLAYYIYQAATSRPEAWEQLSDREQMGFRNVATVLNDEAYCSVCGHDLWCTLCNSEECEFCGTALKCPTCAIATALDCVQDVRTPKGIRRVK